MHNKLLVIFFAINLLHAKVNYGIELELNNFEEIYNPEGFQADFTHHVTVSYRNFKLFKKGLRKEGDILMVKLNDEFSMSSEQKKGSTFTITYPCNMQDLKAGKYYFLLDNQNGDAYRSNIFVKNRHGKFQIYAPIGKMIPKEPEELWYVKYKLYIFGLVSVLLVIVSYGLVKLFTKNKRESN